MYDYQIDYNKINKYQCYFFTNNFQGSAINIKMSFKNDVNTINLLNIDHVVK